MILLSRLANSVKWFSKTHYEILKVNRNATAKEIQESYIKLSKQLHPDKQQQDEAKTAEFLKLTEAYSTLSRLESKRNYDNQLNHKFVEQFKDSIKKNYPSYMQAQSYWSLYKLRVTHPVYRVLIAVVSVVAIVKLFLMFLKLFLFLTTVFFMSRQLIKRKGRPWKWRMFRK